MLIGQEFLDRRYLACETHSGGPQTISGFPDDSNYDSVCEIKTATANPVPSGF
jgi:hypothetical protein